MTKEEKDFYNQYCLPNVVNELINYWLNNLPFTEEIPEECKEDFLNYNQDCILETLRGEKSKLQDCSIDNFQLEELFLRHKNFKITLFVASITDNERILSNICEFLLNGKFDKEQEKELFYLCEELLIHNQISQNLKVEILTYIVKFYSVDVRRLLAKSNKIPYFVIKELSQDNDFIVRGYIASNISTPDDILHELKNDKCYTVQSNVCLHPNCPEDILLFLAKNTHIHVKRTLISNELIPFDCIDGYKFYWNEQWGIGLSESEIIALECKYPDRTYRFYGQKPKLQEWISSSVVKQLNLQLNKIKDKKMFFGEEIYQFDRDYLLSHQK